MKIYTLPLPTDSVTDFYTWVAMFRASCMPHNNFKYRNQFGLSDIKVSISCDILTCFRMFCGPVYSKFGMWAPMDQRNITESFVEQPDEHIEWDLWSKLFAPICHILNQALIYSCFEPIWPLILIFLEYFLLAFMSCTMPAFLMQPHVGNTHIFVGSLDSCNEWKLPLK